MQKDVNQYMDREEMSLADWDSLLSLGWDRVGNFFFHRRYDMFQTLLEEAIVAIRVDAYSVCSFQILVFQKAKE